MAKYKKPEAELTHLGRLVYVAQIEPINKCTDIHF